MVAELPRPIGRALDVGCGEGGVGRSLRAAGATEVHGVEIMPAAAAVARESLDSRVRGRRRGRARRAARCPGPFDTICCYDVLEHLVDPERGAAPAARRSPRPAARLHISIPNARHFSLVYDLVVRGTFGYTEFGHRDATHLRWFTRRDLVAMVGAHGLAGARGRWATSSGGHNRRADRLTRGKALREFLALQWHLLAHPA